MPPDRVVRFSLRSVLAVIALVIAAWGLLHMVAIASQVLAWIFVAARLVHAYIHVTDNNVNRRGPAFGLGALVLTIMWLIFMIRILLGI